MSETRSLAVVEDGEYDLIESAVMESGRGRRFLAEYARRNRSADTDMLLGAIGRLETSMVRERGSEDAGRLHGDLMEMAQAISRTRSEISALHAPDQDQSRLTLASEALDAIVRATETATSDILGAAEEIQEAAWTLREGGASPEICDELDRRATQIYTACSFQDITAQRTSRVVHTLRYLEDRIASMIGIWGQRLDDLPPPAPGEAAARPKSTASELCQNDVDLFLQTETDIGAAALPPVESALPLEDDLAFVPVRDESAVSWEASPTDDVGLEDIADDAAVDDLAFVPVTSAAVSDEGLPATSDPVDDDLSLAFADLDNLSIEEKLALFS